MFSSCESLVKVDLSGLGEGRHFKLDNICTENANMTTFILPEKKVYIDSAREAFFDCILLQELDFSNCIFLDKVSNYQDMMVFCVTLGSIKVGDS